MIAILQRQLAELVWTYSVRGPSRANIQIRCEALLFLVGEFPMCKERGELEERVRRAPLDLSRALDDECLGAYSGDADHSFRFDGDHDSE